MVALFVYKQIFYKICPMTGSPYKINSRTLVLGLGNALVCDDAIGLVLVQKLSEQIKEQNIEFKVSEKVGLNLIELLQGYDRAIIIDSIITGKHQLGEVIEFSIEDIIDTPRLRCPHDADFKSSVELARITGLKMPEKIIILGIEVQDNLTFSENLSPKLSSILPSIINNLALKIESFAK